MYSYYDFSYNDIYNRVLDALAGISIGVWVFLGIVTLVFSLVIIVMQILHAYAIYRLSSACERPYPWLAWLGLLVGYCSTYALIDIPSPKPFKVLNIYTFQNRTNAFWTILVVNLCSGVVTGIVGALAQIPFLGLIFVFIAILLPLAISAFSLIFSYVILKDILETFKPGCDSNTLISILSLFIPFMMTIVLLTLLKYQPVPNTAPEADNNGSSNNYTDYGNYQ